MSEVIVRNRQELDVAMKSKSELITIEGDLAKKLQKAKKISKLSKAGLAILTATLGVAAAPVAAITGVEIAAIIAASALGIALVLAIFKEYDEVSYNDGKLKLKRKKE